jgi:hypothetical protein
MGYMHINNLYRNQDILLFKRAYCLEKIHGTSCHLAWDIENKQEDGSFLRFFSGGAKHEEFIKIFDKAALIKKFEELGIAKVLVYGEGYGGKMQGMKSTYGESLRFIAFDVKIDKCWLAVPQAEAFVKNLGLEFVHYVEIDTTLEQIDAQRDAFSVQAIRNGCGNDKKREGIVLRPLIELIKNNGERVISKHKGEEFAETKTGRKIVDPAQLEVITKAEAIAAEWITNQRLSHVLDKIPNHDITMMGTIIKAMQEDVEREAKGEIVWTKEVASVVARTTALMYKNKLKLDLVKKAE